MLSVRQGGYGQWGWDGTAPATGQHCFSKPRSGWSCDKLLIFSAMVHRQVGQIMKLRRLWSTLCAWNRQVCFRCCLYHRLAYILFSEWDEIYTMLLRCAFLDHCVCLRLVDVRRANLVTEASLLQQQIVVLFGRSMCTVQRFISLMGMESIAWLSEAIRHPTNILCERWTARLRPSNLANMTLDVQLLNLFPAKPNSIKFDEIRQFWFSMNMEALPLDWNRI